MPSTSVQYTPSTQITTTNVKSSYQGAKVKMETLWRQKERERYRKDHPRVEKRGEGVICKTTGDKLPRESENLCLFTCITIHFFKFRKRCSVAVVSRFMYAIYKMKIEFCKDKVQRALDLARGLGRISFQSLLSLYVHGELLHCVHMRSRKLYKKKYTLCPESHGKCLLLKQGADLLGECKGHPLNDLIDVENFFNLRIRLWARGGPEMFYIGDSDSDSGEEGFSQPDFQSSTPATKGGVRGGNLFAKCLFPSAKNSGDVVNLSVDIALTHAEYIRDIDKFGDQFICSKCDQNFSERRYCRIHEEKCGATEHYKYVGGVFNPRKTVFERLGENEIHVPPGLEFLEHFIVFDFESLLKGIQGKNENENGVYEQHTPISVGVGANLDLETLTGYFLCNRDPLKLVREFVELLLKLSDRIFGVNSPRYQILFEQLEKKIAVTTEEKNMKQAGILRRLYKDLNNLIRRAVVLSFNGSKYDMVLILGYFFQIYKDMGNFDGRVTTPYKDGRLKTDIFRNVLQRGSQIMTMVTERLCFKDLSLFLAPGCSYKKYLENFSNDVEKLEKLIFPYKMVKSFDCLHSRVLPKFEDFWCDLRQRIGISGEQYSHFIGGWGDMENPNLIKDGGTLMDILREYNLADVSPMIRAVTKHMAVYKNELNIDLFFEYISLPAIGLKWMFQNEKEKFYTFPQPYGFLHRQIQNGRTGGLCTVFHRKVVVGGEMRRYYEKGGPVHETPRICKAITLVDATSLYPAMYHLYEFFVGAPIYRRPPYFEPEMVGIDHGVSAESHTWLRYCEHEYGVEIISGHNTGEVCVSSRNYQVDGYSPPTKMGDRGMVFQYDSCKYHGHECAENNIDAMGSDLSPFERAELIAELKKEARVLRHRTLRTRQFLQGEGYDVVSTSSCQWAKLQRERRVKDILLETGGEGCTLYPKSCLGGRGACVTTSQIISNVKRGLFHGLLKVDIHLEEPWATKYEFFPFFCQNQLVYRECLSEEMQKICRENGTLKRPTKQLISTSNAKSIILTSQLLKWYLEHHAKVDNLHWCLEYKKAPVFRDKIQKMAEWRRASTVDKKLKAQADCAKLLSNASIGKTGEDVSRHTVTKICGTSQVHKYVGSNKFMDATPIPTPDQAALSAVSLQQRGAFRDIVNETDELEFEGAGLFSVDEGGNQLYLVHMDKSKYVFKNPSVIQFTVYNHAKMHMLKMTTDVLLHFMLPGSVSVAYTDTDSLCLELAFPTLDECVDPHKRNEYFSNVRHKWFPREWCEKHFQCYLQCKIESNTWDFKACEDCHAVFKREFYTPGIFKVEGDGDRAIFLSPKMYVLENTKEGTAKSGSKGVSQRCNNLTYDLLHEKLMGESNAATPTTNYQFTRNKCGGIGTSKIEKFSISKLYTKRRTMTDNINTLPLKREKVGNYDVVTRAYVDDDNDNDDRSNLIETVMTMLENEIIDGVVQSTIRLASLDTTTSQTSTPPSPSPP